MVSLEITPLASERVETPFEETSNKLTRRQAVRRIGLLATGIGTLGITACMPKISFTYTPTESQFLKELAEKPADEKVRLIDSYYAKSKLSEDVARKHVLPVWTENYQQVIGRPFPVKDVVNAVQLKVTRSNDPNTYGGTELNIVDQKKAGIQLAFDRIPSNMQAEVYNQRVSGIELLRTFYTHELGHYDVDFFDSTELFNLLQTNQRLPKLPIVPTKSVSVGFSLGILNDAEAELLTGNFDELANELKVGGVAEQARVTRIYSYPGVLYFKRLLQLVHYDMKRLVALHGTSRVDQFAQDIGTKYQDQRDLKMSAENRLLTGFELIKAINDNDIPTIERLFPGAKTIAFQPHENVLKAGK